MKITDPGTDTVVTRRSRSLQRRILQLSIVGVGLAMAMGTSVAQGTQAYPTRAISMIVPFAPGGPTDVFARIIAHRLSARLGQSVVVVNRDGAAGNIGVAQAAREKPDGYTILFGTASIAVAPAVYRTLAYDPLNDLQPVAMLGATPALVLVAPDGPPTLPDLVATLKATPGKYSFAVSGYASATHLVTEFFNRQAGVEALAVPYRGSGPARQDLIAKLHLYTFETASSAMPFVLSGALKAIAIASEKRSPVLPDVPTIGEAGYPGINASTWNMVFVPARTPDAIVQRLNESVNEVLTEPDTVEKLRSLAVDVVSGSSVQESTEFLRSEIERWADIARTAGIKPNI